MIKLKKVTLGSVYEVTHKKLSEVHVLDYVSKVTDKERGPDTLALFVVVH